MSKSKRIPWNPTFLVTEDKRVFNTKTNKYLKTSSVGAISIPYKKIQKMRYVNTLHKQAFDNSDVPSSLEPQTLEQWDQLPQCKDFALSTKDRLKNIRFDKIIIPNAEGKLRFYNEKKILEMNAEEIRDYFFAEDEEEIIDDSEQNAETPAPEQKAEDDGIIWDDFADDPPSKPTKEDLDWRQHVASLRKSAKEEEIIDDWDDDGNEIIHDSPKKEDAPIQYGVPIKTATGFKVISDPRDVPPEFRPLKYKGELIDLPVIDKCTDKELAEREIAQNQFLDELWAKWEKDRRGY